MSALNKNQVFRYLTYIKVLSLLSDQRIVIVSSYNLASLCDITSSQVRKDLMNFPIMGKQKVGYNVKTLLAVLRKELQRTNNEPIILVGAGSLGTALLKYKGFAQGGFNIVAAFDLNTSMRKGVDIEILSMDLLEDKIQKENVELAILTVPSEVAQNVARRLCDAGINKILNLTSAVLALPDKVKVNNVNITFELEYLLFDREQK